MASPLTILLIEQLYLQNEKFIKKDDKVFMAWHKITLQFCNISDEKRKRKGKKGKK